MLKPDKALQIISEELRKNPLEDYTEYNKELNAIEAKMKKAYVNFIKHYERRYLAWVRKKVKERK